MWLYSLNNSYVNGLLFDMYVCLYMMKIYVCIERKEVWRTVALKIRVEN